jgi:hypothetical protein
MIFRKGLIIGAGTGRPQLQIEIKKVSIHPHSQQKAGTRLHTYRSRNNRMALHLAALRWLMTMFVQPDWFDLEVSFF